MATIESVIPRIEPLRPGTSGARSPRALDVAPPLVARPSFADRPLPTASRDEARGSAGRLLGMFLALGREDEAHCRRIARWSRRLALELRLSEECAEGIEIGALLHDVGYLRLRAIDFERQGPLNAGEVFELHRHPALGARLVEGTPALAGAAALIASHHERFDGTGYPYGLRGEAIPVEGRIVHLVDAYEAMTRDRPRRARITDGEARAEIARGAGAQFDPAVARAFASIDVEEWSAAVPPTDVTPSSRRAPRG